MALIFKIWCDFPSLISVSDHLTRCWLLRNILKWLTVGLWLRCHEFKSRPCPHPTSSRGRLLQLLGQSPCTRHKVLQGRHGSMMPVPLQMVVPFVTQNGSSYSTSLGLMVANVTSHSFSTSASPRQPKKKTVLMVCCFIPREYISHGFIPRPLVFNHVQSMYRIMPCSKICCSSCFNPFHWAHLIHGRTIP